MAAKKLPKTRLGFLVTSTLSLSSWRPELHDDADTVKSCFPLALYYPADQLWENVQFYLQESKFIFLKSSFMPGFSTRLSERYADVGASSVSNL